MRFWVTFCRHCSRFCLRCVGNFLLWGLWLALSTTFALLLWLVFSNEIRIPQPALRFIEKQLARNGLQLKLGSVSFDTNGHLLIRDFAILAESFDEALLKGTLITTRVDPWSCLVGQVELRELEVSGLQLLFPTALSPSGQAEPYVRDAELQLHWTKRDITIDRLSARVGPHLVVVHGGLKLPARSKDATPLRLPEFARIIAGLRQVALWYPKLNLADKALIEVHLTPSEQGLAWADLQLSTASISLQQPQALELHDCQLRTRIPLRVTSPFPLSVRASVAELRHEKGSASQVEALLTGVLDPRTPQSLRPTLCLSAASVHEEAHDLGFAGVSLGASPRGTGWTEWNAELSLLCQDRLLAVEGQADLREKTATAQLRLEADDGLLTLAERVSGKKIRKWVGFGETATGRGFVRLDPGFKPGYAEAWVRSDKLTIYNVGFEHLTGRVRFIGTRLIADEAYARLGESSASGSYEMDVKSKDYRFLLGGHLRPMVIQPYFKEWWTRLWSELEFPGELPEASVDIQGRWGANHLIGVFVGVAGPSVRIRGVDFQNVDTQLFIRNSYVNGLHFHASRPEGQATGRFFHAHDPNTNRPWSHVDFEVFSTFGLAEITPMFPPSIKTLAAQLTLDRPPTVHAWGRLKNPADHPEGMAAELNFTASTEGSAHFKGFHAEDISLDGDWHDGKLRLDNIQGRLASGTVTGQADVRMSAPDRPLHFIVSVKEAHLGEVLSQAESRVADWKAKPNLAANASNTRERLSSLRINMDAEATGRLQELFSYKGKGVADISGPELGQVRLLGGLSSLLSFTSLRFTNARAEFTLDETKLHFPSVHVTGHNSAIRATGDFDLPGASLDIKAKVWPLEQSTGLVPSALGFVLSPLSHAFEVRLTGTLANPTWKFVYSPLRILTQPGTHSPQGQTPGPATPTEPAAQPASQ